MKILELGQNNLISQFGIVIMDLFRLLNILELVFEIQEINLFIISLLFLCEISISIQLINSFYLLFEPIDLDIILQQFLFEFIFTFTFMILCFNTFLVITFHIKIIIK